MNRAGLVTKMALTALSYGLRSDEMKALVASEEGHRRRHRAATHPRDDYFLMSQAYQHSFFFAVTDERIFGRRVAYPFHAANKTTCARYIDRPAFLFETINVRPYHFLRSILAHSIFYSTDLGVSLLRQ